MKYTLWIMDRTLGKTLRVGWLICAMCGATSCSRPADVPVTNSPMRDPSETKKYVVTDIDWDGIVECRVRARSTRPNGRDVDKVLRDPGEIKELIVEPLQEVWYYPNVGYVAQTTGSIDFVYHNGATRVLHLFELGNKGSFVYERGGVLYANFEKLQKYMEQ